MVSQTIKGIGVVIAIGITSEIIYQAYLWIKRKRNETESRTRKEITEVLFFPDRMVACKDYFIGEHGCANLRCRFTHEPNSLSALYKYLSGVRTSLDVCVFVICCSDLGDVIVDAHKRGVKVRVICDDEQVDISGSQIWKMRSEGINVRTDSSSYLMHHKFVLIDGTILINGSFNWTRQAISGNQENLLITNNEKLVNCYLKEFEKLWLQFEPNKLTNDGNGNVTFGRVEVYVRDRWGILCDDKWGITEANVVCKQMGFLRGAIAVVHGIDLGRGDWKESGILVNDVSCPEHAQTIQSCTWQNHNTCHRNEAAGVYCHENTGCPDNWIAGPSGCYQLPERPVTRREFAVKRCASRGGHLVNIETEAENHFLSHLFSRNSSGPLLTGGTKVDGKWMWEQVTKEDEPQSDESTDTTLSTLLTPLEHLKWFPGWQNGDVGAPSGRKIDRCLFLNNVFRHQNGSDISVDYLFWEAGVCKSTRRRLTTGFKYICERPRETMEGDVGCYSGDGSDYRGRASYTEKGSPCINWNDAPDINPATHPDMGLENNHYCRNPDRDDRPWCWTSKQGAFGYCSIPKCTVDQSESVERQSRARDSPTCKDSEFTCSDQSCISSWWHCDIEPDCPNGDDETGCDYKIREFTKTHGRTIRYHARETYIGATNETCARLCMSRKDFVCRSFSFSRRTRDCRLSDKNSLMENIYPSRREDYYEVTYYLDDCPSMFKCENGRCIDKNLKCNGVDDCFDLSDEADCATETKIEIRLIGGNDTAGTVEVNYLGQWGVVCDDNWDDSDATVVCSMLGYDTGKSTAVGGSYYGYGNGRFLLDEVSCVGNESSLDKCSHSGWTKHDCYSWEAAGVQCPLITSLQVELVNGDANSGRVEITHDGVRGTVCDDKWDDDDARVICKMLGYSDGKAHVGGYFGPGSSSLHILLDNVECTGEENSIADCIHSDWLVHDCVHAEDAGVTCFNNDQVASTTVADILTTTTLLETISVRESSSTSSAGIPSPTTTAATATTTTTPEREIECYRVAMTYRGHISQTETGKLCQRWGLNSPHQHKYHDDKTFPDGSVEAAMNYCRAPDNDTVPWCYTEDRKVRWEYCDVPKCAECYKIAMAYRGHISQTETGKLCQRWGLNSPHQHKYHDDKTFPDGSVEAAMNYCRAPDNDTVPWCYTEDRKVRWEYCDVPKCAGSGIKLNQNVTCGLRPMEAGRYRRDVDDWSLNGDDNIEDDDLSDIDTSLYRKMGRIIGGAAAEYGMYPWQAGIRNVLSSYRRLHAHKCGATIIDEYWVLSAAHCFRNLRKKRILIRTGDHHNRQRDEHEQEFEAEEVFMHEGYNSNTYDYDIALVKLKPVNNHGIIFNDHVQPACLPQPDTKYEAGKKCHISGWGTTEDDIESYQLKSARVPLVDDTTCNRLYKWSITENMVCAGYIAGGVDACTGDSGGPLVCDVDGIYTIMGVTSFGEGCAVANAPGVYTRVTSLLSWINYKIRENT